MRQTLQFTSFVGLAVASAVLSTGCPDRSISEVSPEQGRVEYKDIPVTVNRNIDILFLIDDSPSMADKQRNLGANFPQFINVLNTIQGGLPNVHIGVTTSDMGASATNGIGAPVGAGQQGGCTGTGKDGKLQVTGGAVLTDGKTYISDSASGSGTGRITNYGSSTLADTFQKMATGVGVSGCGFEQHLEGMKHALDKTADAATVNAGFLRADAYLAIIIIADEDDCSLADKNLIQGGANSQFGALESFRCTQYGITCDTGGTTPAEMGVVGAKSMCHSNETLGELTKVQGYIDFVTGLKADPQDVIVALIGGPDTPVATEERAPAAGEAPLPALAHSCNYTDMNGGLEVADPSVRQSQFINAFPNRSTFTTICNNDLTDGLVLIAQLLKSVIGSPCIDGKLAMPYDCSVSDVTDPGTSMQTESILPECSDTSDGDNSPNAPCWEIITDTADCTMNGGVALKVKRNNMMAPMGDHVIANCVTEVTAGSGGTGSN